MFDFPASPTVGQIFSPSSGVSYRWNGYGWESAAPTAGFDLVVADSAPGSPTPNKTLWWESDTGNFYLWFDDGNSKQWVQISGPVLGLPDAPSDGKNYTRINGVWRATREILDLAGATQAAPKVLAVPSWAKFYTLQGEVWVAQSGCLLMQVSLDGTTWIAGATDYQMGGSVHNTGSTGFANYALTGSTSFFLGANGDNLLLSQSVSVRGSVGARGTNGGVYAALDVETACLDSGATTGMRHFTARGYINLTANAGTRLAALRFFPNYSPAALVAGSQLAVEWS